MHAINDNTAVAHVYEAVKDRILCGTYRAHDYLREANIAKELEVSRTPVREAFRELISEGWIEAIPHRGARVTNWTEQDAQEVFEIRLLLEPLAVKKATHRLQSDQLDQLTALAQQMETLVQYDCEDKRNEIANLNHEFHRILIHASGSTRLIMVLESIVITSLIRRNFQNYHPQNLQHSMQQHREILQAITLGNPEWAESVMRGHLFAARDLHLRFSKGDQRHDVPKRAAAQ